MLLSGADGEPKYYELPEHLCMKVKIEHPTNEGINSMNLEWFGLPGNNIHCTMGRTGTLSDINLQTYFGILAGRKIGEKCLSLIFST